MAGSCENGNEPSASIKEVNIYCALTEHHAMKVYWEVEV
jgi:hypothetical protein